jgi:hypothetical protein
MAEQPNIIKTTLIPTQEEKDDYAIEFASFIDKKYYQHKYDNNKYAKSEEDFNNDKTYNIKQLLQIFKKERNL